MNARLQVRKLGPYVLGRRVGAGGMATVFAARKEGPFGVARLVALKLMATTLTDDAHLRKLFAREAGIATRIEHPNVVRTYDVGEEDGVIYLAMEYVHGVRVSSLQLLQVPLPITLRIVCDAAHGLHAAHEVHDENGMPLALVHQDVSPQNIMVGYDGVTKLLDFGVARLAALDGSRMETLSGKASYVAPEQIRGDRVDRRADVFSLGIVLYELLAGRRLFARPTDRENYDAILAGGIPDVRDARREVPEAIAAVVADALKSSPADRLVSAEQVRQRLLDAARSLGLELADPSEVARWVKTSVPAACTPSQLEREILEQGSSAPVLADVFDLPTVPPVRRARATSSRSRKRLNPRWSLVGGLALLLLVVGVVWSLYGGRATPPPTARPLPATE